MGYREWLSAAAIALTFAGFVPYIRTVRQGRVKPHVFSWMIWGSTTFVVFLAQLSDGGGAGAWPIGVSGLVTLYIAVLAYGRRSDTRITRTDWGCFLVATASLPLWYLSADPFWAVLVLTTVDLAGFGPTLRKALAHPFEENLTFFILFALRNLVAILALERYTATTVLFPAATGLACVVLIALVGLRRQRVAASRDGGPMA
ncbi:hypothetical protein BTO32_09045 [Marinobacter lutaoensis]|uniref:Uncharacterized protein n=1 Tax=Marinobacter lutaoensis TaxID=135739 RepID=A0A1V2DTE1_9GAMM|nr:hypothetical protein [Marinobacter lutaoensis]ONF43789.1 hypothetical protein BTO32_09045 [Marinobacter lutaoensis]